jgi:hypothetical protein
MLTEVRLPVAMALLLILASWLRGRILALLTLGHRGPRITATQELLLSTFNALQATGTFPPLSGPLRRASVGAGLLRAARVLVRHFFDGKSSAGVNWRMGGYAPPHREIYLRSPALLFRCHRSSPIHTSSVDGEPKAKFDGAPVGSVLGTRTIW